MIVTELYLPPISLQEEVTTEWDLYHDYTTSQLGLHDLMREYRAELDIYSREPGRYRYWNHSVHNILC